MRSELTLILSFRNWVSASGYLLVGNKLVRNKKNCCTCEICTEKNGQDTRHLILIRLEWRLSMQPKVDRIIFAKENKK